MTEQETSFHLAWFLLSEFVKAVSQQQSYITALYKPDMCTAAL